MRARNFGPRLRRLLASFPSVTVLGPRQCGKTTFIRNALPSWTYLDLERPSDVEPLAADPEARLEQLGDRVILDEAQRLPALFPVLRGVIDRLRSRRARYVLLGSAAPSLVRAISESLAGRTAFLDLPPFRWDEVARRPTGGGIGALWLRGGLPRAYLERDDRARFDWLEAYTRAFIERDLPGLGIEVSAAQMRKLWTMLAHFNGSIWNASQLAAALGTSYHTVNRYVDILEQAFLVRRLPPYHANVRKRLVKSPKLYLRDSGLLHYFLGVRDAATLAVHPARGLSWESFVIDQLHSAVERAIPAGRLYFWRTAQGDEVDVILDLGSRRVPLEIKTHTAPTSAETGALRRCMDELGLGAGYVVHAGRDRYSLGGGVTAVPAATLLRSPASVARL